MVALAKEGANPAIRYISCAEHRHNRMPLLPGLKTQNYK